MLNKLLEAEALRLVDDLHKYAIWYYAGDVVRDLLAHIAAQERYAAFPHWAEHVDYPLQDWQQEVANEDTRLGYWAWVENQNP